MKYSMITLIDNNDKNNNNNFSNPLVFNCTYVAYINVYSVQTKNTWGLFHCKYPNTNYCLGLLSHIANHNASKGA